MGPLCELMGTMALIVVLVELATLAIASPEKVTMFTPIILNPSPLMLMVSPTLAVTGTIEVILRVGSTVFLQDENDKMRTNASSIDRK
jgi:hypothetical protein